MLTSYGADTKKVRNINRSVVVNVIRECGPISKTVIARQTGISFSTVNRVVEELLHEQLIEPDIDNCERGSGRPGETYIFNGKSHFVMGIDLGIPNMRGMIADLSGTVYHEVTIPVEVGNGSENYRRLLSLVNQLLINFEAGQSQISGVGLGVAGVVDSAKGIIIHSEIMGWDNFTLARLLNKDTGLSIFIDSDINLITMGEYGFGVGQGLANLVCVTLGTGVHSGILINGEIFRGTNFCSGRMGSFLIGAERADSDTSRHFTSLEGLVSATSILKTAKEALQQIDQARAKDLNDGKAVYQAARNGEAWALEIIQGMVPYLAIAVANISLLLDPDMIVFTGRMAEESSLIIPMISSYLNGKVPTLPHIQPSPLGTRATVLGAIMLVYNGILRNW